jgi:hypothetical protein
MTISEIADLLTALGTLLGLVYIARQISDTRKHALGEFLFTLDAQFREYEDIHDALFDQMGPEYSPSEREWKRVLRYVGLFERCQILLENQTLSIEIFDSLYGYRLYSVVGNHEIHDRIIASPQRHEKFIALCGTLAEYKSRSHDLEDYDAHFIAQVNKFPQPTQLEWRRRQGL